jgi:hypothetical protein
MPIEHGVEVAAPGYQLKPDPKTAMLGTPTDASVFAPPLFLGLLRLHPGSVKKKVEPCPGVLSSHSRPPCRSTIFLHTASPMPVPS